jgi:hypothetical protein
MLDVETIAARLQSLRQDMTVLPDGSAVLLDLDGGQVLTLSETGTFLVERLQHGTTETDALAADLCDAYAVEPDQARRDVDAFLRELAASLP